ncbi:MAG: BRO family protein [Methanobrevibacter sp.]
MVEEITIKLFKDKGIRAKWDSEIGDYYYSIIDIIEVLTESKDPNAYWRKLKQRLKDEGNETVTNCHALKMPAKDGKMRLTDVANTKELLRLIQSIPSPKAEPLKLWLAEVGNERIAEISDPEIAISRAIETYRKKGYSEEWISQRMRSIETRKDLTAEWNRSGVKKPSEYAILTDEISEAWSGMTTRKYKDFKGLKKESLRDNMTNMELILNMLAEGTTTEISKTENPEGFDESRIIAHEGGEFAGEYRQKLEKRIGRKLISKNTSKNPKSLNDSGQ